MRVVPALIGLILLSVAIFGAIGLSGGGTAEANVPACIPPAACDAGVSHETLEIPNIAGLLDVSHQCNGVKVQLGLESSRMNCHHLVSHCPAMSIAMRRNLFSSLVGRAQVALSLGMLSRGVIVLLVVPAQFNQA